MKVVELSERPHDWDARIRAYSAKTLFHESCWHDHLLDIHPAGRMEYAEVRDGDAVVGLICGISIRKYFLKIYGSPLGGTGTNYMGPLLDNGVDQSAAIRSIQAYWRARGVVHAEVNNAALEDAALLGAGFLVHEGLTHVVPIPKLLDEAWSNLASSARNRIRKSEKNELLVELEAYDSIADEYSEQLVEVYGKQGMSVPFGPERARSLVKHLRNRDRLLAIRIRYHDVTIATGLFPHDERGIYFWGGASWLKYQKLNPNELLHWSVIRFAVEREIPVYDMCGGTSQFKDKFGGDDIRYQHYTWSAFPMLDAARNTYRSLHWSMLKLRHHLKPHRTVSAELPD